MSASLSAHNSIPTNLQYSTLQTDPTYPVELTQQPVPCFYPRELIGYIARRLKPVISSNVVTTTSEKVQLVSTFFNADYTFMCCPINLQLVNHQICYLSSNGDRIPLPAQYHDNNWTVSNPNFKYQKYIEFWEAQIKADNMRAALNPLIIRPVLAQRQTPVYAQNCTYVQQQYFPQGDASSTADTASLPNSLIQTHQSYQGNQKEAAAGVQSPIASTTSASATACKVHPKPYPKLNQPKSMVKKSNKENVPPLSASINAKEARAEETLKLIKDPNFTLKILTKQKQSKQTPADTTVSQSNAQPENSNTDELMDDAFIRIYIGFCI